MARTLEQIKNEMAIAKNQLNKAANKRQPTLAAQWEKKYATLDKEYKSLESQLAAQNAAAAKQANAANKTTTPTGTRTNPNHNNAETTDAILELAQQNGGATGSSAPAAPAKTPEQIAAEQAAADKAGAEKRVADAQTQRQKEQAERNAKIAADPYGYFGLQSPEATREYYQNIINEYNQRQTELANKQAKARNADYDKQQNENYINYMMAQRALPEQLARLGLSGGASETSQLRANMNYANQRGATNLNRNAEIAGINTNLQNAIANYLAQQNAAMRDETVKNQSELYARRNAGEMADREYNLAREQADEAARQFYATNLQNAQQFATSTSVDRDRLAEEKRGNRVTEAQNAAQQAETKRMNDQEIKFRQQELSLQKAAQDAAKKDGDFDKAQKLAASYGTTKQCDKIIKNLSAVKKPTTYQKYLLALTRARKSEIQGDRQKAIEARQDSIILYNKTKK